MDILDKNKLEFRKHVTFLIINEYEEIKREHEELKRVISNLYNYPRIIKSKDFYTFTDLFDDLIKNIDEKICPEIKGDEKFSTFLYNLKCLPYSISEDNKRE